MEFLVQIEADLSQLERGERRRLLTEELARGRELLADGTIAGIWALPGVFGNVGVWRARDAAALDGVLRSLPLHPYLRIEITELATHPLLAPAESADE